MFRFAIGDQVKRRCSDWPLMRVVDFSDDGDILCQYAIGPFGTELTCGLFPPDKLEVVAAAAASKPLPEYPLRFTPEQRSN
jgi:hypothetical protein